MGYLELGEIDRKRYGIEGRIEFANHQFGMRSIKALKVATGYDYEILARLLAGVPKVDPETKEPVYERDADGNIVKDEQGNPKIEETVDEDAIAAFVWLVLREAGHKLDWDTFDVHPIGLVLSLLDSDEEPDPGKDEATSSSTTTDPT